MFVEAKAMRHAAPFFREYRDLIIGLLVLLLALMVWAIVLTPYAI